MEKFPPEFSDLLQDRWSGNRLANLSLRERGQHLGWFPHALRPNVTETAIALLGRHVEGHLRAASEPIPTSTITSMRENYRERLPKTLHNRSVGLNSQRSAAFATARRIGLAQMLGSSSLRALAERISGYTLEPDPGLQVICYRPGDYVGPHNDHHPEEAHLRQGYVDLQITLCNTGVAHQYLLYESGGYFNNTCKVGVSLWCVGFGVAILAPGYADGSEERPRANGETLALACVVRDRLGSGTEEIARLEKRR